MFVNCCPAYLSFFIITLLEYRYEYWYYLKLAIEPHQVLHPSPKFNAECEVYFNNVNGILVSWREEKFQTDSFS